MSGLSRRWAWHVTILLAITLVPVTLHSYVGIVSDDCANASSQARGRSVRFAIQTLLPASSFSGITSAGRGFSVMRSLLSWRK